MNIFFKPKFRSHRVLGLTYLLQYVICWYQYITNYESYYISYMPWILTMLGTLQAINATLTFHFLPKKKDTGYFSDKHTLSYNFVKENIFFALLLWFQCIYYNDQVYHLILSTPWLWPIELLFVTLPYTIIRQWFPKTHFRGDIEKNEKANTTINQTFMLISTWIAKLFYLWAKHYIGFFMNYHRYLKRVTKKQQYHMHSLFLFSGFATTISMFLHTLKFKKLLHPRISICIYIISYLCTFYCFTQIYNIFFSDWILFTICLGGLVTNILGNSKCFSYYQCIITAWLLTQRLKFIF